MTVSLIAAMTKNRVIGKNNDLPWKLPDDMKYFQNTTKNHVVIMGRKNYDSLPTKFKPLPNRTNIVLTRQENFQADGCVVLSKLEEALDYAGKHNEEEVFVIGGGQIYEYALDLSDRIYLTEINAEMDGDTFFPKIDNSWEEIKRTHHPIDARHEYSFDFVVYQKK